jgi:hypothetical protein
MQNKSNWLIQQRATPLMVLVADMLNMTTRADLSVVDGMATCQVQSSCMNAIAYGGGSGYATW